MTPETVDLLKLFGGAGFGVALLYVIYLVGTRMIVSNDRSTERWSSTIEKLGDKIDAHRDADVASHGEMRSDIAALHGKMDGLLDGQDRYTPVGGIEIPQPPQRRTPAHGVSVGAYGPTRPGTKGGR